MSAISLEDSFNVELFIDEIKNRRSIWDVASEDYKDRDVKKLNWIELTNLFFPDFNDETPKQKTAIINGLQKKWKNMKDSYRKHLRSKSTKSGQERKTQKNYIFAPQLSFLDEAFALGPSEDSANVPVPQTTAETDVGSEEVFGDEERLFSRETPKITLKKRKCSNLEQKLEHYIDTISNQEQKKSKLQEDGDDMHFFKSLLPIVENFSLNDKMLFRMDVMKTAIEYSNKANNVQPRNQIRNVRSTKNLLPDSQPRQCNQYTYSQPQLLQIGSLPPTKQGGNIFAASSSGLQAGQSEAIAVEQRQFSYKPTSEVLKSVRAEMSEESDSRDCITPGSYSVESGGISEDVYFNENDFNNN